MKEIKLRLDDALWAELKREVLKRQLAGELASLNSVICERVAEPPKRKRK